MLMRFRCCEKTFGASRWRAGGAGPGNFKQSRLLMYDRFLPEPCDLVLHLQLASFQFRDLQTVRRWVGKGIADFLFKCAVPSFEFRKMRFDRHMAASLRAMTPVRECYTGSTAKKDTLFAARRKSPLCTTSAGLWGVNQNAIIGSNLPA